MADNSSKKFKFISPGVFVDEIDQSQLPSTPTEVGPVVIGRARKGPANKPVKIESFSDFVQTFGNPVAGNKTVQLLLPAVKLVGLLAQQVVTIRVVVCIHWLYGHLLLCILKLL